MEVSGQLHATVALLLGKDPTIGGWVGPTDGLVAVAKKKNPITAPDGNGTPVVQPVSYSLH
jgi:hypothetical protein